ncbi:MAG: DUF2695 domain-containing protein [Firmicutes bacterium]|nr:DUF2695 domain-containing protein [Bacillota bacterium]
MKKRIMTPRHPRWKEFRSRLEGPEGCDFKVDENGKFTFRCKGGDDKSFAEAILKTMPDIDIPKSLEYFEKHGGFCDCKILLNVGRR